MATLGVLGSDNFRICCSFISMEYCFISLSSYVYLIPVEHVEWVGSNGAHMHGQVSIFVGEVLRADTH